MLLCFSLSLPQTRLRSLCLNPTCQPVISPRDSITAISIVDSDQFSTEAEKNGVSSYHGSLLNRPTYIQAERIERMKKRQKNEERWKKETNIKTRKIHTRNEVKIIVI
jgi:hypothetical protein